MSNQTNYEVLGISRDAEPVVISAAYRALAKKYHPDIFPDKAAGAEKLKAITTAYEILSDQEKRKTYDAELGGGQETVDEEPPPGTKRKLNKDEAKQLLIKLRDEVIYEKIPDIDRSRGILRKKMINCLLINAPTTMDEFESLVPFVLKDKIDPRQNIYLEEIFEILGDLNS